MGPDDFGNHRIKLSHQRASCLIVMLKRSPNQRACVRIIHVLESASTPLPMTGNRALRLQVSLYIFGPHSRRGKDDRMEGSRWTAQDTVRSRYICNAGSSESVIRNDASRT